MKRLSRKQAKPKREKSTHYVSLTEAVHGFGIHTVIRAWPNIFHTQIVCWRFQHPSRGVVEVLPCQVKVLSKIKTRSKRTSNDKIPELGTDRFVKAGDRAAYNARISQGIKGS